MMFDFRPVITLPTVMNLGLQPNPIKRLCLELAVIELAAYGLLVEHNGEFTITHSGIEQLENMEQMEESG